MDLFIALLITNGISCQEMNRIEKSNLHLQQQNYALANKRTQELDLSQNKNLTN